jgi:glutamyl-tRNA(Gln) amidotransferase subunit E
MEVDYEKFGLRCGIEIHQQLSTKKLFCNCPSCLRDDAPHFVVKRKLRAVAGETGEIDIAAQHETEKGKEFNYEGYSDSTCLIELDEAPPNPINMEALQVALQSSLILNARPVDEIQVMRKTVVNGSNTTGFQRTALVSKNGYLDTSKGRVSIQTVCIEEEAAREIKKEGNIVTYRLDRLGIPLVEIATGPEIRTPEQCKEAAEKIGMILRSTGKARRGIGTIRQDVNISIKEGNRVEIKGVQDLKLLPLIVELEIIRQLSLIEIKNMLEERNAKKTRMEIKNVSSVFKNTQCGIIKNSLQNKNVVLAIPVPFFSGLLKKEIQRGKRLGAELSDHAKLFGVGGLFHSDENLAGYGIAKEEIADVTKKLGVGEKDSFIVIADKDEKARKALEAVKKRIAECFEGVPREVRNANPDGSTTYMRPMPGASRMYPETDVVPVRPRVDDISLPELISDKMIRFEKEYSMSPDLAELAAYSEKADSFEQFAKKYSGLKPAFIAEIFLSTEKSLSRKYEKQISAPDDVFGEIFDALQEGKISKEIIPSIILEYSETKTLNLKKYELLGNNELEQEVKRIVKENEGLEFNFMINKVMGVLRGKGDVRKIIEFVKKYQKI